MRIIPRLLPALLFCALFFLPSQARADALTVTAGSVSLTGFGTQWSLNLQGQGVQIQGRAVGALSPSPIERCFPACQAGQSFSFDSVIADFGTANLLINGTSYSVTVTGSLRFTGSPLSIPTGGDSSLTVTDSFMLRGTLAFFDRADPNTPLFTYEINGQGLATIQLNRISDPAGLGRVTYDTRDLNYNLNPVPEPATLFLLGTGLAGIAARARRRRSSKTPPRAQS